MKFATVTFVALASVATAQLSDIPSCALTCLLAATSDGSCSTTDFVCQCGRGAELVGSVMPCINGACSTEDQQAARKATDNLCNSVGVPLPTQQFSAISSAASGASSAVSSVASSLASSASSTVSAASSASSAASVSSVSASVSSVQASVSSVIFSASSVASSASSVAASASSRASSVASTGAASQATQAAGFMGAAAIAMLAAL